MPTETTPKIAMVSGGSRGLGRASVQVLAKRGVDTIFTYHSNCDEVVESVEAAGARTVALRLDTGGPLPQIVKAAVQGGFDVMLAARDGRST